MLHSIIILFNANISPYSVEPMNDRRTIANSSDKMKLDDGIDDSDDDDDDDGDGLLASGLFKMKKDEGKSTETDADEVRMYILAFPLKYTWILHPTFLLRELILCVMLYRCTETRFQYFLIYV